MTGSRGTILIVEDEVLVGIMLAKKIRAFGYNVLDVVTTGEEAVTAAENDSPQVILMDITLAGTLDGLEAARIIRQRFAIPVILFTGYDHSTIAEKTDDIKPVAVLSKMGPMEDITAAIEQAIRHH